MTQDPDSLIPRRTEFPESRYLSFELDDHYEGKTERVLIISKRHLAVLGEIKWLGRWRQYAFFPESRTVWNPECMDDIKACLAVLKQRRENVRHPVMDDDLKDDAPSFCNCGKPGCKGAAVFD